MMKSWLKNVWFLNLNWHFMLPCWLMLLLLLFFVMKFGEWNLLVFIIFRIMLLEGLFVEVLIRCHLISFSIVIYITVLRIYRWTLILRGWWFKSVSKHCLIHLIFNDIPTLLPIFFILWRNNLFKTFRYLVSLFRSIILLVILLNHQRRLLSKRWSILRYTF